MIRVLDGDILDSKAEVVVNAWNRNLFPWWLLVPRGVARRLRATAGIEPFRELRKFGMIPLGGAVVTGPGNLSKKAIVHVAGIDLAWRASAWSIGESTKNALRLVKKLGALSVALPIIGSGSGGFAAENAEALMVGVLMAHPELTDGVDVEIVRYRT